ncbi:MAG: HAMP domain-containing histidine kinase [Lachnospiraceae bacterium]|nr:HAMP domain-containing histidine kinase [Lachnospiraceae bacterium]
MTNKKKSFEAPNLTVENLSRALYDANQKQSEIIRERDEIYANISHDLRSPITAIHNAIEYLQSLDHITEADIKATLPLLAARTEMLEYMIEEIFLLTKLDSSSDMFHFEAVPAAAFLEDFFYMCEADDRFANRDMQLNIADNCDVDINIDVIYMKRVLDNILKNALAHTSSGDSIILSAKRTGDMLKISIENNGEPILAKDLPNIFKRTYMASNSRTPGSTSGAGLGLSICKSIIEKHGGQISAYSDGIKGSCFYVELPVSIPDSNTI